MSKTFKVLSPVIRLRRHGGVFVGRNNVEYPIHSKEQYEVLKSLEPVEVQMQLTPSERDEYEAAKPTAVAPKEPAKAPEVAPKAPEAPAAAPVAAPVAPSATASDKAPGNEKKDAAGKDDKSNGDI